MSRARPTGRAGLFEALRRPSSVAARIPSRPQKLRIRGRRAGLGNCSIRHFTPPCFPYRSTDSRCSKASADCSGLPPARCARLPPPPPAWGAHLDVGQGGIHWHVIGKQLDTSFQVLARLVVLLLRLLRLLFRLEHLRVFPRAEGRQQQSVAVVGLQFQRPQRVAGGLIDLAVEFK